MERNWQTVGFNDALFGAYNGNALIGADKEAYDIGHALGSLERAANRGH